MKALIQRVSSAAVWINDELYSSIDQGILVFIGIKENDTKQTIDKLLEKIYRYRIFTDKEGRMSLSVRDIKAQALIVSQFTLVANTTKGLRPDFKGAGNKQQSKELFDYLEMSAKNLYRDTKFGLFAADMSIKLVNDGPVTFLLEN